MLQTKIERATFAVDRCVEIGRACRQHSHIHAAGSHPTPCSECIGLMEIYGADLDE